MDLSNIIPTLIGLSVNSFDRPSVGENDGVKVTIQLSKAVGLTYKLIESKNASDSRQASLELHLSETNVALWTDSRGAALAIIDYVRKEDGSFTLPITLASGLEATLATARAEVRDMVLSDVRIAEGWSASEVTPAA